MSNRVWFVMLASIVVGCGGSKPAPPKPATLAATPSTQPAATRPGVARIPGKVVLPPEQAEQGIPLRSIDGTVRVVVAGEHPYLTRSRAIRRIQTIYENQQPVMMSGVNTLSGAWPWMVALLDIWGGYAYLTCGGALIADEWVLTAAHCDVDVQDDAIVGATDLSQSEGTRVDVASVCVHPLFDPATLDWDVALVKIAQPLSAQQKMTRTLNDPAAGTRATAIGWGWIDNQGNLSPVLQEVSIPVVSDPVCVGAYPAGMVTPRMLCAGENARGGCDGDSGGPLMVQDGTTLEWQEVGIVSWGSVCVTPDLFGVYSRVSLLNQWIEATMSSTQPDCRAMF